MMDAIRVLCIENGMGSDSVTDIVPFVWVDSLQHKIVFRRRSDIILFLLSPFIVPTLWITSPCMCVHVHSPSCRTVVVVYLFVCAAAAIIVRTNDTTRTVLSNINGRTHTRNDGLRWRNGIWDTTQNIKIEQLQAASRSQTNNAFAQFMVSTNVIRCKWQQPFISS